MNERDHEREARLLARLRQHARREHGPVIQHPPARRAWEWLVDAACALVGLYLLWIAYRIARP